MLNQVQKELLKKHIGPFFFCFFTVMFILLMQFLILHVDKLVGKGLPLMIIIELILNNLAYMVVLAVPMAVLVSTLMAFGKLSEWNELTALRAAGINPIRLMKPVLFTAGFLFIFMAYFSNYILPESNHKARSLFLDIRMQKPAFDLQPGSFYDDIEGYTFLITEIDSKTDSLYDIRVFQEPDDNRNRAFISAEKGWLETPDDVTLSLFLLDGSALRYVSASGNRVETLEKNTFNQYRMSFDLSDLAFSRSNPEQRSRNDRTMSAQAMMAVIDTIRNEQKNEFEKFRENTSQDIAIPFHYEPHRILDIKEESLQDTLRIHRSEFITLNRLPNPTVQLGSINRTISTIDRYRPDLESLKTNLSWRDFRIAEYWVEVHKKLSIPFACLVFVFLGAPIGMLTKKGNIGVAAIISAGLLTIYFVAIIQGEKLADRLLISPFMGMWAINILLLIIGVILTLHISTNFKITNLRRNRE